MATELKVPTLGMDMEEATIVRWLVEEGAEVELPELTGTPFVKVIAMVIYLITGKAAAEPEDPALQSRCGPVCEGGINFCLAPL
jgi:hypothetical protein